MNVELIPADYAPYAAPGLPPLYGPRQGWCVWMTALPLTHLARFRAAGSPAPSKGYARDDLIAEAGEVIAYFENDDGSCDAPERMMLDAARWLVAHDAAFHRAVRDTLLADLPRLRAEQDGIVLPDDAFVLPPEWDEATLYGLIRLNSVAFHAVAGAPYIGLDFGCVWDPEHGYGMMMAGTDVVETGGADVGGLSWIAARHAESIKTAP
ncbi:DUF6985 domain-containing protein [Bordetella genomosp. 5]|uniref:DUF6985 domain-containing protein n=1 Tax=Bordetella genomosp. 5 TaxID=1395608 RepID=UPI0020CF50AC|nr:hypothetical protein [Bordetella genomosp. 5]